MLIYLIKKKVIFSRLVSIRRKAVALWLLLLMLVALVGVFVELIFAGILLEWVRFDSLKGVNKIFKSVELKFFCEFLFQTRLFFLFHLLLLCWGFKLCLFRFSRFIESACHRYKLIDRQLLFSR